MSFASKIVPWDGLRSWRRALRAAGQTLVVTNGCFDLLHMGHVGYLEAARALGGALLVGVNGDAAVRGLKGPGRPINSEIDRAGVIAALECVSAACIFHELRATRFLAEAEPDLYVKGGDYTIETLDPEERAAVERGGGRIVLLPLTPGKSTTNIARKLAASDSPATH